MIDHVLGRPSVELRKFQVITVFGFWIAYLYRGNKHGFPLLRRISERLSGKYTPFQIIVIAQLYLYFARNFSKVFNLESPEPLANLYSRAFFRATWVTTALDAGFWTAMSIRKRWIRRTAEILFTIYYLIATEQADEKVRKIRSVITVNHMRISWEKSTTPVISFLSELLRPRLTRFRLRPRVVKIPRPPGSKYTEPLNCWLYYDGPLAELARHTRIVMVVPGGGFVSMSPRNHDERLIAYAGRTGVPVVALDYGKAPEFPYPYAVHEAYDLYKMLVITRGRCIGLAGEIAPKIVVDGDSAGGNIAAAMVLMVLQQRELKSGPRDMKNVLPVPDGLILVYPALDLNIGSWMTDDQMSLVKDRTMRKTNKSVLRKKSLDYKSIVGDKTPYHSDDEDPFAKLKPITNVAKTEMEIPKAPEVIRTRLAMSSIMSFLNDRILNAEMMRAMIILYVGPLNRPDFYADYLLCPLHAPESLLAQFPKTYFMTGELDPLVDSSILMAGRIRQAKLAYWEQRCELGLEHGQPNDKDWLEVSLIPGVSHGFMQIVGIYPDGWKYVHRAARWIEDLFAAADQRETNAPEVKRSRAVAPNPKIRPLTNSAPPKGMFRLRTDSSGDDERPLKMSRAEKKSFKLTSPSATEMAVSFDDNELVHQRSRQGDSGSNLDQSSVPSSTVSRRGSENLGRRSKSLVSLASEEDLLRRRMDGFAQSLLNANNGDDS